eukprot:TRINITY_DN7230_c0_g2_i1.p2 TRINITY_DN7230_c0_g2~~TRINITY_DN7230_c0_g2_i1.p2  ORF type:complete len:311 (+),score=95.82 TRINITY_DN7230_c0_g2_i1:97-1029(+)
MASGYVSGFVGPFRIGKMVGAGSCASVYAGVDTRNGKPVAIKMASQEDETLPVEAEVLKRIGREQGFARYHWYGGTPDGSSALVTDLLGSSLGGMVEKRGRGLKVRAALKVGLQLLSRVEHLHKNSWVHRDIKPDNCLFGIGKNSKRVYLIDFGLSQNFRDNKAHHVAYDDKVGFSGTPDFASLRSHTGVRQTRRDDLESLGYVIIYLIRGSLPWQGLQGSTDQEVFEKVRRCKEMTTVEELCQGCPKELSAFLHYVRTLPYNAEPDYARLRNLLQSALQQQGASSDALDEQDDIPASQSSVTSILPSKL